MERSLQSQLEQALVNAEKAIHIRDKEIAKLRAQVKELKAALENCHKKLDGR